MGVRRAQRLGADRRVGRWAGREVPYAHGQWLAANVPGAVAHLFDDAGHITLLNDLEEVLVELLELGKISR